MLAPSAWGLPACAQFVPACIVAAAAGLIMPAKQQFQHANFKAAIHGLIVSSVLQKCMNVDKIVLVFEVTCSGQRQVEYAVNAFRVIAVQVPVWLPAALVTSEDCQASTS
jgi:hypothetical protein